MIKRQPVSWWMGYETLLIEREMVNPEGVEAVKKKIYSEIGSSYYHPVPFQEFAEIPPLRHFPHVRFEKCLEHIPGGLEGKSVADIGANMGYYTFMSAESGAKKVWAVDPYDITEYTINAMKEIYGYDDQVRVFHGPVERFPLHTVRPDVVFAFSVLPYVGKASPDKLKEVLAKLARYAKVSFIEMGDGGSEMKWCVGDDAFRALLEEAEFPEVELIGTAFASHAGTHRAVWKCVGTRANPESVPSSR